MKQLTVRAARLHAAAGLLQWLGVRSSQRRGVESHFYSRVYSTGHHLRATPPQLQGDPGYMLHAGTKSRAVIL